MLNYIIGNLISNAVKYSDKGKEIILDAEYIKDQLFIKVVDNGIGIPINEIDKIFEPFYRSSNSVGIEGTGLGLNIVKSMVEMLNGRIEVTSKLNSGSTFIVTLPLEKI